MGWDKEGKANIAASFPCLSVRNLHLLSLFLCSLLTMRLLRSADLVSLPEDLVNVGELTKNKRHNFSVAVCAIVMDAEAYLMEWIDYNLIGLAFDNMYIYDNSPQFDLKRWYNQTRTHDIYKRVHVLHHPGRGWGVQLAAYDDCIHRFGNAHDYIALIDVDEYFVLMQYPYKHVVIHDVIDEYLAPYGGALTANWVLIGTSNRTIYAPIPVLKRFQFREESPHEVVKSIVKTSDYVSMRNPHAVTVRNGTTIHTTHYPGAIHKEQTSETGSKDHERPGEILLLYHYRFLSIKEYTARRCQRGQPNGRTKGCDKKTGTLSNDGTEHNIHRPGTVRDSRAWDFLTSKVSKYAMFDHDEWEDYT